MHFQCLLPPGLVSLCDLKMLREWIAFVSGSIFPGITWVDQYFAGIIKLITEILICMPSNSYVGATIKEGKTILEVVLTSERFLSESWRRQEESAEHSAEKWASSLSHSIIEFTHYLESCRHNKWKWSDKIGTHRCMHFSSCALNASLSFFSQKALDAILLLLGLFMCFKHAKRNGVW